MTTLQNLEKSIAIYNQIKELDTQIIAIEKRAIDLAENDQDVLLTLGFKETEKAKNIKSQIKSNYMQMGFDLEETMIEHIANMYHVSVDSIHPLGNGLFGVKGSNQNTPVKKPEDITNVEYTISATDTLEVFGVLIRIKKAKRIGLMKQLLDMGFQNVR